MSASELLDQIEALPDDQRRWLMEKLFAMEQRERRAWAEFSAKELAGHYGPKDSVYDED